MKTFQDSTSTKLALALVALGAIVTFGIVAIFSHSDVALLATLIFGFAGLAAGQILNLSQANDTHKLVNGTSQALQDTARAEGHAQGVADTKAAYKIEGPDQPKGL